MKKAATPLCRLLCLLLIVALTVTLAGCGARGSAPADTAATAAPAEAAPSEPSDAAHTEDSADAPADPAAGASADADAAAKAGFFLTAEYDRLYFAPLDGSAPQLLVDAGTVCTARWDEWVYASFDDGRVLRLRADSLQTEELLPAGGRVYRELVPFDGGFLGVWFSMREGSGGDLYRDGSQTPEELFPGHLNPGSCVAGKYLYCLLYGTGDGVLLAALRPDSLETVWEKQVNSSTELMRDDAGILCFIPNSGELYRLDEDTGAMTPVSLPLEKTDCDLLISHDGVCLVRGNYSDDNRNYLVSAEGRRLLDISPYYFRLKDMLGSTALLYHTDGEESAASENTWYTLDCYRTLDLKTGVLTEFPVQGRYGALFAEGDFPVMDSSTARKPVTSEIYAFFCESTGAGGTVPLCSTTHGAWLNIADGVADLALLAAPTQEEQDYLDERGVSVEMKLYGGDGLVFIGNRSCGVENLSLEQVRAIYRGEIRNWAELGGADHPIRVLYRDDQSGSQRLFERMLWKDEPVPDFEALGYDRLDEMSTIVSECLYDPYALGYSIMTYLNDVYGNENLLSFSLEGYAATPENVASGNYPLGTQGYAVIRSDEPEGSPARRLFDWFGSPLSDVILTRNGVTPLHGGQ